MLWMNKNGLIGPIAQAGNDDGAPVVTVGGHLWYVRYVGNFPWRRFETRP
jgi:hypothetical protein